MVIWCWYLVLVFVSFQVLEEREEEEDDGGENGRIRGRDVMYF